MAGIGFALRRLGGDADTAASRKSARRGPAAIVAPWAFAIIALETLRRDFAETDLAASAPSLQAGIIYLFLISLVAAAPVTAVAMRLVFDDIYRERREHIATIYLLSLAATATISAALAIVVFGAMSGLGGRGLAAAAIASIAVAMTWTAASFATAIRRYRTVTLAFLAGFAFSVVATLYVARHDGGIDLQLLAFACGLGLASVWLSADILEAFGEAPAAALPPILARIAADIARIRVIALAAFVAAAAIWTDSIVVWLSPYGQQAANGLATMPFYDSAMFVSRVSMLPALLVFLTLMDGEWCDRIQGFLRSTHCNETLDQITAQATRLRRSMKHGLLWLIALQAMIALMLYVLAPALVEPLGMLYQQVGILRVGVLGALFYVVFAVQSTLVLNFGRDRAFLALQLLFLLLNAGATLLCLRFGTDYLGFGFLFASIVAAIAAAATLDDALKQLPYITFANALRQARTVQKRRRPSASTIRWIARLRSNAFSWEDR